MYLCWWPLFIVLICKSSWMWALCAGKGRWQITWDTAYLAPLAFYLKRPGFTRIWEDEVFWRACPTIVTCLCAEENVWETSIYKSTRKHCWVSSSGNTTLKPISVASYIASTTYRANTQGETRMSKCFRVIGNLTFMLQVQKAWQDILRILKWL